MSINLAQQLDSYTWQQGTVWKKQSSSFPVGKTLHWSLQFESSSGFSVFSLCNAQNTTSRWTAFSYAIFILHFRILKWEQLFTKHEMSHLLYTLKQPLNQHAYQLLMYLMCSDERKPRQIRLSIRLKDLYRTGWD